MSGREKRFRNARNTSQSSTSSSGGAAAPASPRKELQQEELEQLLEEKRRLQRDELRDMLLQHAQAQKELRIKAQKCFYEEMELALRNTSTTQLRKLGSIYENELTVLRKLQDDSRKQDMRDTAKKHKDKQELARVKRELGQKHINSAVMERQKVGVCALARAKVHALVALTCLWRVC